MVYPNVSGPFAIQESFFNNHGSDTEMIKTDAGSLNEPRNKAVSVEPSPSRLLPVWKNKKGEN